MNRIQIIWGSEGACSTHILELPCLSKKRTWPHPVCLVAGEKLYGLVIPVHCEGLDYLKCIPFVIIKDRFLRGIRTAVGQDVDLLVNDRIILHITLFGISTLVACEEINPVGLVAGECGGRALAGGRNEMCLLEGRDCIVEIVLEHQRRRVLHNIDCEG